MSALTVRELVSRFLAAAAGDVAPSTFAIYRHYGERFAAAFESRAAAAITPADVAAWSRLYHPCGVVQRIYRWAVVEARLLVVNPIAGMRSRRNAHRRRVLSRLEQVTLRRRSCRAFRLFLLAMAATIARPREIRDACWGHLRCNGSPSWSLADLRGGRCYLLLTRFKSQSLRRDRHAVRIIPIPPRLGRAIARLWSADVAQVGAIFRNVGGGAWTVNAVRCQMRRLRVRAAIGGDVEGEQVVAYTMRHTAATEAVGTGIATVTLAELMGHADIRMTRRYVHLRPDHLIAAANRVIELKTADRSKNGRTGSLRKRSD